MNFSVGGSSSGYDKKRAIVDQYPNGSDFTCYCNPEKPWEAVIQKKVGSVAIILATVLPAILILVGLVLVSSMLFGKSAVQVAGRGDSAMARTLGGSSDSAQTGELVFKVGKKRIFGVFGALFFALFWNGIVSFLVYQVWEGWSKGSPEWFLTIFAVPFVLIGVGLICYFFYRLMALFNPKPELRLSADDLVLGRELDLAWEFKGPTRRVKKWNIFLQGIERATYRRGTDTRTDEQVFFEEEVVVTENQLEIISGRASIRIPADLVPSWKADNNEILWKIVQCGEIAKWPDIKEEDVIEVRAETL